MPRTIQLTLVAADKQCKAHNVRLTPKRKQVLEALLTAKRALSAYELRDYCKEHFALSIPAMSMYRILDVLQDENLVHRLKLANKYIACSHIRCSHTHAVPQFLICEKCEAVKEIDLDTQTLRQLNKEIEASGFKLTTPQFEVTGVCDRCLEATV